MPASLALDPTSAQPEHARYAEGGWPCAILIAAQMLGPGDQAPDIGPRQLLKGNGQRMHPQLRVSPVLKLDLAALNELKSPLSGRMRSQSE